MNVLKMGTGHNQKGINCQDATGILGNRLKVVCDGCSEGNHSEVGAKLFCKMLTRKYANFVNNGKKNIDVPALIMAVIDELASLFDYNPQDIKDYLSFTILVVEKMPESNDFYVYYCGDGYVLINKDGYGVVFQKLDCGEYPEYLSYNYISSDKLAKYGDGVKIHTLEFECYCNIGIASDGIRFVADLPEDDVLKNEFKKILFDNKEIQMKFFFNRNAKIFQDDFSIVF